MVVITGRREVPSRVWKLGGRVQYEMGDSRRGTQGESPTTCFSPVGGEETHAPIPIEGRREVAPISPGFVPGARLENSSIGRLVE